MIKKHIPNTLTLANLSCGCIGIVACTQGNLPVAAYMVWLAALFDFLDGFVARLLKVSSPIGKELDSLADMVTFGVLPSFILFQMLAAITQTLLPYLAFVLALLSALRLAKFNIDTRQTTGFIGMPTPAAAFFVSGLVFWSNSTYLNVTNLSLISILLALLLVVPLPMLALKFKNYSLKDNIFRYMVVIVSTVLLFVLGKKSFPWIITSYLALSLISLATNKQKTSSN